jgi:precorrin isomerase
VRSSALDNILVAHPVPGVARSRQGVSRQLSTQAVVVIGIARQLSAATGVPLSRALVLAQGAMDAGGTVPLDRGMSLTVDVTLLARGIEARLAEAAEVVVPPRRGRPPGR